jgi:predicted dehydrogenase
MKQIIQSYKTGEMKLEEVPRPSVTSGMILVENKVSLVSAGTEKMLVDLAKKSLLGKAKARPDLVKKVIQTAKKEGLGNTLKKVRSKLDNPIPLGYSCAGVVLEVGRGVDDLQVGDRVACGGAGYANHSEFNVVPKNLCVRIPRRNGDWVSYDEASAATVSAIALQGVRQAQLSLGETVCIIGLGLLGQLALQMCKAHGCRVIGADIDEAKIELAHKMGADQAVHSSDLVGAAEEFTAGYGVDAVIITAAAHGNGLVEQAGEISRQKGRVVAVGFTGMDLPRETYYKKELDFRLSMSYGPGRYDAEYEERGHDYPFAYVRWTEQRNMQAVLDLCATGRLDVKSLMTHRFPFEAALDAYQMILKGTQPYLGVLLEYAPPKDEQAIELANGDRGKTNDGIHLGVIGAGNFAKSVLLPRLAKHPDVRMAGVMTGRGMSAKAVGKQFGFAYCTGRADEIIADDRVNTVLVATRHNLHGQLVVDALKAGHHVFVEKPLCLNMEELRTIVTAMTSSSHGPHDASPPILMVGFNRRFAPYVQQAQAFLHPQAGPLVATYTINAGMIPKDSWIQDLQEGGGRIVGEVCHFVDTLRYLTGAAVQTVYANCVRADSQVQTSRDSLSIILKYANGALGVITYHAGGHSDFPKERIELARGGTTTVIDDFRSMAIFGKKRETCKGTQDKGFDNEIKRFVRAVKNGGSAPIPPSELIETTLVTFAVEHSLNTGQPVDLGAFAKRNDLPVAF